MYRCQIESSDYEANEKRELSETNKILDSDECLFQFKPGVVHEKEKHDLMEASVQAPVPHNPDEQDSDPKNPRFGVTRKQVAYYLRDNDAERAGRTLARWNNINRRNKKMPEPIGKLDGKTKLYDINEIVEWVDRADDDFTLTNEYKNDLIEYLKSVAKHPLTS